MKGKSIMRLSALVSILAFQTAGAEPSSIAVSLPDDAYRTKYEQSSDMPNHLAYLALMYNLTIAESESGHSANMDHVRAHMSLDGKKAEEFLRFVLASYDEMVQTNQTIANRMLCKGAGTAYDQENAYAVLDVLDDIKDTNLKRKYELVEFRFGSDIAAEMDSWLDSIKKGSSHHRYDHKKVYEHMNQSVEQVIAVACNQLAAYIN